MAGKWRGERTPEHHPDLTTRNKLSFSQSRNMHVFIGCSFWEAAVMYSLIWGKSHKCLVWNSTHAFQLLTTVSFHTHASTHHPKYFLAQHPTAQSSLLLSSKLRIPANAFQPKTSLNAEQGRLACCTQRMTFRELPEN